MKIMSLPQSSSYSNGHLSDPCRKRSGSTRLKGHVTRGSDRKRVLMKVMNEGSERLLMMKLLKYYVHFPHSSFTTFHFITLLTLKIPSLTVPKPSDNKLLTERKEKRWYGHSFPAHVTLDRFIPVIVRLAPTSTSLSSFLIG